MKLDRTRIAIVERRQPELLDLAFLVLREFFLPVVGLFLVLALPLALMNYWLIEWMSADLIEELTTWRYLAWMAALVYVEAPFASVLTTAYLGKATFHQQPKLSELLMDVVSMGHRIVWTQLILRGVLLVIWMFWMIDQSDAPPTPTEGLLMLVLIALLFWRSLRPYLVEIVLLERSPLWSNSKNQITVGKRSSRLHGPNSGDLFARGLCMLPVTGILALAVFGCLWFIVATLSNDWSWGWTIVHVVVPSTFWILAIYTTVFRFLSYLDLRIRREGWEVELKMRAEANRMAEGLKVGGA